MPKIFAKKILREERINREWTQQEMCDLLAIELGRDLSLSTYQKWEQGTLNLTPDIALMISRFLRVQVGELVERK